MAKHEPFSSIHESGELLTGISGYFIVEGTDDAQMLVAVRFDFNGQIVALVAQDDDTLGVFGPDWVCTERERDVVPRSLSMMHPWNVALNEELLWSWRMVNQQGYFDGMQLQFGKNAECSGSRVQLMVVASEIKIFDF